MKKLTVVFSLLLALLLFFGCSNNDNSPESVVAHINGESITRQELNYFKTQLRPKVMSSMIEQYSAIYDENFWQNELGGTTPEKELNKLALEKCCRAKLLLMLCSENGIYDDISFSALKAKAAAYNENPNVVGIKSIDEKTFYDYYIQNGELELKNVLCSTLLKPTDAEIDKFINDMSAAEKQGFSNESLLSHARNMFVSQKLDELIENELNQAEIVTLAQ